MLARPALWPEAVRQAVVMAPRGWWRRWPPSPLPDAGYLAFRMQTMYGDAAHPADGADLVTWLRWCREHRQVSR